MHSLKSEEHLKVLGLPEKSLTKILLVDVDSLFDLPMGSDHQDVYTFAVSALQKAYKLGWGVRFWATYPRYQYTRVMRALQGCSIWDFADPQTDQPLLLRTPATMETPTTTKLILLEEYFGEILDDSTSSQVVVVERDLTTANALWHHTRGRIRVHLSPMAWPNLLAVGNGRFDGFLSRGLVA